MNNRADCSSWTSNDRNQTADLAGSDWDIAVIGAGPAGAVAAIQLAARGMSVVLLDSKAFPRDKVCGGCLNQRAWQGLQSVTVPRGKTSAPARILAAGASEVNRLRLNCLGREANWALPGMHAISRRTMDDLLIRMAIESGVIFCAETAAKVVDDAAEHFRKVQLMTPDASTCTIRARIVIAADGLGHSSLNGISAFASQVVASARIGLGTLVTDDSPSYAAHELTMSVGHFGYVGVTRVENAQLNVAAAVDTGAMKQLGPAKTIATILASCNLPMLDSLRDAKWTGTLPLTRQSQTVAARRLFAIGDAAGYVEPFTGEGMSWAIVSALQFCNLLVDTDLDDCERLTTAWIGKWRQQVRRKQLLCRGLAGLLRHPQMAGLSLAMARSLPWIPQWLIARVSGVGNTYTGAA